MPDLLEAIESKDLELARRLLADGASPNPSPEGTWERNSPLVAALLGGHEGMVRLLLEAGAEANFYLEGDLSPLAAAGTPELIRVLVEAGARVPLESGHVFGFPGTSLHYAAENGAHECLSVLLDEAGGKEVLEAQDEFGRTAVGVAANEGNAQMLSVLLERGASPNGGDIQRSAGSPLEHAVLGGHLEAVRLLLAYGADPDRCWGLGSHARAAIHDRGNPVLLQLLEQADSSPRQFGLRVR